MALPEAKTPLYGHPLHDIEKWLAELGCQQDQGNLHCWQINKKDWEGRNLSRSRGINGTLLRS